MEMADKKGLIGLTNIGNTCYGNSVLQALRHQVDLTLFLLQGHHKELLKGKQTNEKRVLLEKYGELLKKSWMDEEGCLNTRDFWAHMIPAAITSGMEHFRFPVHHDAHEFLVFLLDQFHEALAEEVGMTIKTNQSKKNTYEALNAWKKAFEKSYSPLVELVFHLQQKKLECSECKHESLSWDTCNMLKVSVPQNNEGSEPLKLLDLLEKEMNAEVIEGYGCDGCKKKVNVSVTHKFWRLGNWVIIVLKRNQNNGRKIFTQVEIPMNFSFTQVFHPLSEEPSRLSEYELFSTINHHGSSFGGHYNAQAKHPVTNKWAFFDDETARPIDMPILDASTYIVMYRKIA
jgi:ubiquitin carboxyl-terminal hydrolase 8